LCDSADNPIDYQMVQNYLERLSDHRINQIGLLWGISGWFSFPKTGFEEARKVAKLVRKTTKIFTPAFNHIGLIDLVADTGKQREENGNVEEYKKQIQNIINLGCVGYSGKKFYVSAFCTKGTGQAMHDFVQKELDEYVKRMTSEKTMDRDDPKYMEYVQSQLMDQSAKKEGAETEKEEGAVSIK